MAQDLFQYEKMVEAALRGVVRDALQRAAREGLKSAHHFYIGFATQMPGVVIPDQLHGNPIVCFECKTVPNEQVGNNILIIWTFDQ